MTRDVKHRHDTAHVGPVPVEQLGTLTWKTAVRAATTANGTLATAYENGDTVDGVVLATGDRILLKNQTTGSNNGIYTVNASGAPTRAGDMDGDDEVKGAVVFVREGTVNAGTLWRNTNTGTVTIGTTALTFVALGASLFTLDGVRARLLTGLSAVSQTDTGTIADLALGGTPGFAGLTSTFSQSFTIVTAGHKHYLDGGSGLVIPILSADPDPGDSEIAQLYYNDIDNVIRWYDGTVWDDVGAGGGGAPDTADYLVGTAQAGLSAEIVVGATPGGELGGTWASPTVDATHSGSSHAGLSGQPGSTDVAVADGGTGASTAGAARTNLGLVIGTDVQAFAASASQAEMEAGTEAALRAVSPLRVAQAIAALATGNGLSLDPEVPAGTINGVNDTFTLSVTPDGLILFKNGLLQREGAGNDYTLATNTITYEAGNIPQTGDTHVAYLTVAAGGSSLIAISTYMGSGGDVTTTTTSSTFVDVDAANMVVTFTAPASGNVLVRAYIPGVANPGSGVFFNLRESTTNVTAHGLAGASAAIIPVAIPFYVTGISAGSHTYKLGWRSDGGTTNTMYYGNTARGPVIMEVWGA